MKKKYFIFSLLIFNLNTFSYASSSSLETIGDIGQIVLPVAGASIAIYKHDWLGLKELTYAGLATLIPVQVIKYTVHRERPNGHMKSFPSGHTAAAFWGAGFLQMRYGWYYGVPAYVLAGVTGYSRIPSHNHWTSDVLAGAVIGLSANFIFTRPYAEKLTLTHYVAPEGRERGVMLTAHL